MENLQSLKKYQIDSNVVMTLSRQIEALTPLAASYQNLKFYREKMADDLSSLIEQHDYAISNLKSAVQNLSIISMRTQAQRNDVGAELKDRQNDYAKLILDTRNIAQKYEALNQKLKLEQCRTDQNQCYKSQLFKISTSLQTHIQTMESVNTQLLHQQISIQTAQVKVDDQIERQSVRKCQIQQKNEALKCAISKINLKNDDQIDANRKLSQQIKTKDEEVMSRNKLNRQLKERLIELKGQSESMKSQIDYKATLLNSQNSTTAEFQNQSSKLNDIIGDIKSENGAVCEQNELLSTQISALIKVKNQNTQFKLNSQQYLTELIKANEMLLSKMEQYCIQDREVQNLLIRKMSALHFFSQKLNKKYEIEQQVGQSPLIMSYLKNQGQFFKQKSINLQDLRLVKQKGSIIQGLKGLNKTNSTQSWMKQNSV